MMKGAFAIDHNAFSLRHMTQEVLGPSHQRCRNGLRAVIVIPCSVQTLFQKRS